MRQVTIVWPDCGNSCGVCPALIKFTLHVLACCCSTTVGESVRISIRLGGPVGKLYNKSRELRIPNFTKSGSGRHVLLTHVRIRILINFPAKNVSAGVVVDYADMTMTMLTWTVTFCCSLRRKIKYTQTIILSLDNWGLAQV